MTHATKPGILLPAENVAELVRPAVTPYVWAAERTPWDGPRKHSWVRMAVLAATPLLKASVKELRDVPNEVLADGVDMAIHGVVKLLKEVLS